MTAAETEARRRFCAKPLRKGKWTETEQRFSEKLIECFLAGVVQDCTDGTTLRAFLSRKLHCAPMRITKKFAGATLGKMIFYRAGFLDPRQLRELESFEAIFLGFEDAQDNDGSDGDGDADDAGETGDASPRKRPLRNRAAAKEDKEESVSSSPRAKAARPLVGGRGSPESSASESGDEDCSVRGDDEDFSDVDAAAETDAVSVAPKRSEPAIFKNAMYAQHQHQHVFARGAPHRPEGALKWAARVAETAAAVTAARRSSELEVVRGLHAA